MPPVRCERARPLLPRLADGALGVLRHYRVSRHLARCPGCARDLEDTLAMRAAIRTNLPYHRAPPSLAARIGAVLPREVPPTPSRPWHRGPALRIAATGVAGALAGVALTLLLAGGPGGPPRGMVGAAVDSHIRAMMADHLIDIATSDRHTVKPWLSARLDVSPPVRDLAGQGFPLVGGRLDYIDGHPAAAVVYRHDRHVINLFAWAAPGAADAGFHAEQRQGFNVVTWRRDGVAYCAVSDVEAEELAAFTRDIAAPG
jgi:anti-sigma factor RsiW